MSDIEVVETRGAAMSEMVERVARAICMSLEEDPDATDTPYEIRGWRLHVSTARAAIAAMREPTDWMIDRMTPELMIAENAWRAGIDAALGETR